MLTAAVPEHHGFGRPRRRDAQRDLVLFVAWARDVAGLAQADACRLLYSGHCTNAELKRVRRAELDGRRVYREIGVLPWAAYGDGRPPSEWWTDPAFTEYVRRWQLEAVSEPSKEQQPDLDRARREATQPLIRPFASAFEGVFENVTSKLASVFREGWQPNLPDPAAVRDQILRAHGVEPWSPSPGDSVRQQFRPSSRT